MKKIYESPNTVIVKIDTQRIIAASEQLGIGNDYNGSDEIQAHRSTLWGDNE